MVPTVRWRFKFKNQAPAQGNSNWLPAPAGPYQLILRTYQPKPALFNGSYKLPAASASLGRSEFGGCELHSIAEQLDLVDGRPPELRARAWS